MATFITQGNLVNQLNGKSLRNIQRYSHALSWTLEQDETWQKTEIYSSDRKHLISSSEKPAFSEDEKKCGLHMPQGMSFSYNSTSVLISGICVDVDTYHPIMKTYIWSGFEVTRDMFKDEYSNEKATLDDVKNQLAHYTGKWWGIRGIQGWYRDGNTLSFDFVVDVHSQVSSSSADGGTSNVSSKTSGYFGIQVVPNYRPEAFCEKYCTGNYHTDDYGVKYPNDYESFLNRMVSMGFKFLLIDRTNPNAE